MKRIAIPLLLIAALCLLCGIAQAAEPFTLRNGIRFGETMDEVKAKETFEIEEEDETTLTTVRGKVAGISNVAIEYTFQDGGLHSVKWLFEDFSSLSGVREQYDDLVEAFTKKYGSPLGAKNGYTYLFTGSGFKTMYLLVYIFSAGDTGVGEMDNYAEWAVESDGENNVKIDIYEGYYGVGFTDRSFFLGVEYTAFTDAEFEQLKEDKEQRESDIQDDI